MEEYSFLSGALPIGSSPEFEISLFNDEKHRLLQAPDHWQSFFILNQKNKRISAAIHFHVSGDLAQSPLRSPFGSLEFAGSVPARVIFDFLGFIETSLKALGASRLVIKNYPQAYAENESVLLQTLLLNLSYSPATAEIGSVIEITSASAEDVFNRSARRRLEKARHAGFVVRKLGIEKIATVYTFIQQCRAQKQYAVSMSLEDLHKAVQLFPDDYILFGVFNRDELVAASITIRVKKNILYDFYHDHTASYDHVSPVVLLVSGIYEFCQDQKMTLLDLGTSALNGVPNFPLLRFKETLGGRATPKFTFEKTIT